MVALSLLVSLVTPAHAEPYVMAGAGITVNLPRGWEMTRWSDWDFKAKADGLILDVWYTPWQVDLPVGTALQPVYVAHLKDQGGKEPAVLPSVSGEGPAAWLDTKASFGLDGGGRGNAHFAAIRGDGKVIHIGVYGASDRRAASEIAAVVQALKVDAPPAKLNTELVAGPADGGFSVKPAAGWRAVLASEQENAEALLGRTGAGKLAGCALLASPTITGEAASVMAVCQQSWKIGFADDNSFADDAKLLRTLVFSKAADKIPEAEKVALKDRNAMLFRPTINDYELRFAALSYDAGAVSLWAIGPSDQVATLEQGVKDTLSGLQFSGPDNGLAQYAMGELVFHELSYNPLVMGVAGLTVFGILGGLGVLMMRKPAEQGG